VIYSDRRGGYIDNVPTTFTRNPNVDRGPSAYSSSYPAHLDTFNNYLLVNRAQNPTTYQGIRLAALYQINDDWNVLIQQTYQYLDAEGMPVQMPVGLGLTPLQPLQETSFMPAWNKDKSESTAWTVNGKIGFLKGHLHRFLPDPQRRREHGLHELHPHRGWVLLLVHWRRRVGSCPQRPGDLLLAGHGLARLFPEHAPESRVAAVDAGRLAAARPPRGVLGRFPDQGRHELPAEDHPVLHARKSCRGAPPGRCAMPCERDAVQAAIDPTTRNDNTNFGEDLQRGYKQTAVFGSADFDIIPKVLTLTGGTRYFKYVEQEVGSQYSDPTPA